MAKRASHHLPSNILSLTFQDLYPSTTRAIRESWQDRWDKLALIKSTVERCSSSTLWARHREVVLTRLRIDHTRLTHGHLMTSSDPPRCPSCHVPFSLVHFLINCPRYASLHCSLVSFLAILPSLTASLSLVLTESISFNYNALFAFLMRSSLLSNL